MVKRSLLAVIAALVLSGCDPDVPQVTWDQYQRIQPGMSYKQVATLLKQPGERQSGSTIDGQTVRTYAFGPPEAECLLTFAGDTLIDKTEGTLQPPPLDADNSRG